MTGGEDVGSGDGLREERFDASDLVFGDQTGAVGAGFCDACLTGTYPVAIPIGLRQSSEVPVVVVPTATVDTLFSALAPVEY